MATLTEEVALLNPVDEGMSRLNQLDALLNFKGGKKQSLLQAAYNSQVNLDLVQKNWNMDIVTPELESNIVDVLVQGLQDNADERVNRIREIIGNLEKYDQKVQEAIALNRDNLNYFLVVFTLILSIFVPNIPAGIVIEATVEDMWIFLTSMTLLVLPSIYIVGECTYTLLLLSNVQENFISFENGVASNKKGVHYYLHKIPYESLQYTNDVLQFIQNWTPSILVLGCVSLLLFYTNAIHKENTFISSITWIFVVFVTLVAIKSLMLYSDKDDKNKEGGLLRFIIQFFNKEKLLSVSIDKSTSSVIKYMTLFNDDLEELMRVQEKYLQWLDKIIFYDAWQRKVQKKFKYIRKLEEVINYHSQKKIIDTAFWSALADKMSRWANLRQHYDDWLLYDQYGNNKVSMSELKMRLDLEGAVGEKWINTQKLLRLQESLFKIQNLQYKCRTMQKEIKSLLKPYTHKNPTNENPVKILEKDYNYINKVKQWTIDPDVNYTNLFNFVKDVQTGLNNLPRNFPIRLKMLFLFLRVTTGLLQIIFGTINFATVLIINILLIIVCIPLMMGWFTSLIIRLIILLLMKRNKIQLYEVFDIIPYKTFLAKAIITVGSYLTNPKDNPKFYKATRFAYIINGKLSYFTQKYILYLMYKWQNTEKDPIQVATEIPKVTKQKKNTKSTVLKFL